MHEKNHEWHPHAMQAVWTPKSFEFILYSNKFSETKKADSWGKSASSKSLRLFVRVSIDADAAI